MDKSIIRTFLCIPVSNEIASKKNMLFSTINQTKVKVNWVKKSKSSFNGVAGGSPPYSDGPI